MAVRSLSTVAPLMAVVYSGAPTVLLPADLASIANSIKEDPNIENAMNQGRAPVYGAFSNVGRLFLPWKRSGANGIRVLPGDVVAVDVSGQNVGWPIVVSADAIANGSWSLI